VLIQVFAPWLAHPWRYNLEASLRWIHHKMVVFHGFERLGSKAPEMAQDQIIESRDCDPKYKLDIEPRHINKHGK
jgi:hypothetical protein